MSVELFKASNLTKRFGGLTAVNKASLSMRQGEIYGLIGPNGAGKTTFFNLITGLYQVDEGTLEFKGKAFKAESPSAVCQMGIARTFQNIRLFSSMTALENVLVGLHHRLKQGVWATVLRTRSMRSEEQEALQKAQQLLEYVGLPHEAARLATELSYGDQRRLEIARALASGPSILALDEPAAGMNATEKQTLRTLIERVREDGTSILLIEHDVKLVMGVCDRVTVLDHGEVIAVGSPQEIQKSEAVLEAYLGRKHG